MFGILKPRVILTREAAVVILRREAPKGSLSIQGLYGRGAKAILSLAALVQDDAQWPPSPSPVPQDQLNNNSNSARPIRASTP